MSREAIKKTCLSLLLAGMAAILLTADPSAPSAHESTGHLRSLAAVQKKLTEIKWKPRMGRHGGMYQPGLKPVMHTFYHWDDDLDGVEGDRSEADEMSNRMQMTEWASAWYRAGWDVKILTMKDVKSHPSYVSHRGFLEQNNPFGTHSSVSLWRWFAMGTVPEGGWMADFDTFPLNDFKDMAKGKGLPNGGRLTTHAGHVPALVSGTRDEYNRMAKFLVSRAQKKAKKGGGRGGDGTRWTDLHLLKELREEHEKRGEEKHFEMTEWAMPASEFVALKSFDDRRCDALRTTHKNAVHFSREEFDKAVAEGNISGPKAKMETRWEVCEEWIGKWESKCNRKEESKSATRAVA